MPMHVVVAVDSADAMRKLSRLRRAPTTGLARLKEAAEDLLKRMQKQGTLSHKYLNWDTLYPQRTAWFASDGFTLPLDSRPKGYVNSNDRYVRTGVGYTNGWTMEDYGKFGYIVSNPLPSAPAVSGDASGMLPQSKLHQNRWPSFHEQIQILFKYLPNIVQETIRRFIEDDRS